MTFEFTLGSKGLRYITNVFASTQFGALRNKIACTENIYEIDHTEELRGFAQFLLPLALIKQASFCFYFRTEATLLKKVEICFQY